MQYYVQLKYKFTTYTPRWPRLAPPLASTNVKVLLMKELIYNIVFVDTLITFVGISIQNWIL